MIENDICKNIFLRENVQMASGSSIITVTGSIDNDKIAFAKMIICCREADGPSYKPMSAWGQFNDAYLHPWANKS